MVVVLLVILALLLYTYWYYMVMNPVAAVQVFLTKFMNTLTTPLVLLILLLVFGVRLDNGRVRIFGMFVPWWAFAIVILVVILAGALIEIFIVPQIVNFMMVKVVPLIPYFLLGILAVVVFGLWLISKVKSMKK